MRIGCFSMGPVFPNLVLGGSQKILRELALHFASCGHEVHIVCPERPNLSGTFQLDQNVYIHAILGFKCYPEPYYSPPYRLRDCILTIASLIEEVDVFYIHDAELMYDFLYEDIPTVISFRDFVYPDTLAGGLSFSRDLLVVNSEYTHGCVLDVFSSFRPQIAERLSCVTNGFNLKHFNRRFDNGCLRRRLGLAEDALPILIPHRPDPRKGAMLGLEAFAKLFHRIGLKAKRLRLLIPIWMDSSLVEQDGHIYSQIYRRLKQRAVDLGVGKNIVFHNWVPYADLPNYYSLGVATLCIGSFVESFSNVTLESEACLTPSIVSRVACHRTLLPEDLICKVNPGDIDAVVDALEELVGRSEKGDRTSEVRDYIGETYPFEGMLNGYLQLLEEVRVYSPLPVEKPTPVSPDTKLRLPTWCYATNNRIYNDYAYNYLDDPILNQCVAGRGRTFSAQLLLELIQNAEKQEGKRISSSAFRDRTLRSWLPTNAKEHHGYPLEIWDRSLEYISNGYLVIDNQNSDEVL